MSFKKIELQRWYESPAARKTKARSTSPKGTVGGIIDAIKHKVLRSPEEAPELETGHSYDELSELFSESSSLKGPGGRCIYTQREKSLLWDSKRVETDPSLSALDAWLEAIASAYEGMPDYDVSRLKECLYYAGDLEQLRRLADMGNVICPVIVPPYVGNANASLKERLTPLTKWFLESADRKKVLPFDPNESEMFDFSLFSAMKGNLHAKAEVSHNPEVVPMKFLIQSPMSRFSPSNLQAYRNFSPKTERQLMSEYGAELMGFEEYFHTYFQGIHHRNSAGSLDEKHCGTIIRDPKNGKRSLMKVLGKWGLTGFNPYSHYFLTLHECEDERGKLELPYNLAYVL